MYILRSMRLNSRDGNVSSGVIMVLFDNKIVFFFKKIMVVEGGVETKHGQKCARCEFIYGLWVRFVHIICRISGLIFFFDNGKTLTLTQRMRPIDSQWNYLNKNVYPCNWIIDWLTQQTFWKNVTYKRSRRICNIYYLQACM